jgi:uncharacterized protein (TIGR02453 family)
VAFAGLPHGVIDFYERLSADNTKSFWQAHRDEYARDVRGPMEALAGELGEFGSFHLFRPHNDLRFSRDRPPYKTHQGAYVESDGGAGYYVQLSAEGLLVAAGYYAMAKDQLERFRVAVDADATGAEVAQLVADVVRRGYDVGAIDELKTAPRGYAKDHPRIALLRRKGLIASRSFGAPAWIHKPAVVDRVRKVWTELAPLCAWLDAHVGPSTLPPEDRPF